MEIYGYVRVSSYDQNEDRQMGILRQKILWKKTYRMIQDYLKCFQILLIKIIGEILLNYKYF